MGDIAGCDCTQVPATASVPWPFPATILGVPPRGCPLPPKYAPMELVPCCGMPLFLEEALWCWDISVWENGICWIRLF